MFSYTIFQTLLTRVLSRESLSRLSDHYSLSARLLSDPLALDYLKLSPAVQTSLFYAYTAGIYRQEGVIYATQWIRQCFRLIVDQEYRKLRDGFAPKIPIREDPELPPVRVDWQRKPGNPNYVLPSSLPLDQLDTHVKRHRLEPPIWLYSVKGVAPDEVFRAELTVGDRTVEGSGRSKNRAKQIAAAAFLGIRDVDPETIKASRRSSELPQTNYTARLFDYVKQVDMATPTFDTMPWPKQPNWKAVLRIGDETFEATGRGQTAARRAAAKKALAFVNPSHAFETILLNHILSRNYTIAFLFEKISSSPPEPNTTSDLNWICKVAVQDAAAKEEIGEVFAKGFTKAIARAA
ncbi:double-stranded RNA binding motif domain-containing protein [Sporobolomyces koalae]|uniref:double-stranded RNA binding motif domain-containing protein n=1 Tax=Sporobolomyces koalae TaxID=500713 RepID=UPI00317C3045